MIDIGVASPSAHVGHRVGHARRGTEREPRDEGDGRHHEHGGNEVRGDDVGEALDGRAAPLRLAHHADDLREQGLTPHPLRPHDEAAGRVECAARHPRPRRLLGRDGLAGQHRLVDGAPALDDDAVDRHLLARPHAQAVAHVHVRERHVLLAPVGPDAACGFRREPEEGADRIARPVAGAKLEHLSQEDQRRDDRRRLEVERHLAAVAAEGGREDRRGQRGHHAVGIGGADPHRDQREHVGTRRHDRGRAALEERPSTPGDDGRRERELHPGERAARERLPQRLAGQHLRHGGQEERQGEDEAQPEAPAHVDELGARLLRGGWGARLERHAAEGAGTRLGADDLRVHRTGVLGPGRRRRLGARSRAACGLGTKPLPPGTAAR